MVGPGAGRWGVSVSRRKSFSFTKWKVLEVMGLMVNATELYT